MSLPSIEYTIWFTALHGLMFTGLVCYISYLRISRKIALGDGGDKYVHRIIRAHANFCEFAPLLLIMTLLLELKTGASNAVLIIGILYTAGRALHIFGMRNRTLSLYRQIGAGLNYVGVLALSICLIIELL